MARECSWVTPHLSYQSTHELHLYKKKVEETSRPMGVPGLAQLWAALPAEVRGNLDKVILATTAKGQVFDRPEPCFDLSAAFYDHLRSSALKLDADSLLTIALHCHGDESVGKATLQAALLPIFVSITEVSCWSCVKGVAVWGSGWLLFLFSFAKTKTKN